MTRHGTSAVGVFALGATAVGAIAIARLAIGGVAARPQRSSLSLVERAGHAILAGRLETAAEAFADDVVWHYFNQRLPELAGDYHGLDGIRQFFEKVAVATERTFSLEPLAAIPFGSAFVVTHGRLNLRLAGRNIRTEVVAVWRIENGRIVEVWDIPAVE